MADSAETGTARRWPPWARGLASAVLAFHLLAMLAVALAGNPASEVEQEFVAPFARYVELIDQGHVHRYYAPAPPPTPVLTAELQFEDGREPVTIRIPDRSASPRIRYQRQLALANHLFMDFQARKAAPPEVARSLWGRSYARHLCAENPGCSLVTIRAQEHRVPDLVRLARMSPGPLPDVDAPRFYTVPEVVGDYPCEAR